MPKGKEKERRTEGRKERKEGKRKLREVEKRKKKEKSRGREGRVRGREEDEDYHLSSQKVDLFHLSVVEESSSLPLLTTLWCYSAPWSAQGNSSTGTISPQSSHF